MVELPTTPNTETAWLEKPGPQDGISAVWWKWLTRSWATVEEAITALEATAPTPGIFLPTLTIIANLDAVTAYDNYFVRLPGDVDLAIVFGQLQADATLAGPTSTTLGYELPIDAELTSLLQVAGIMGSPTTGFGRVYGDAANNRAEMSWSSLTTGAINIPFIFGYVIP